MPYPLCAQGWVAARLLDDPDPAVRPDALETFNPTSARQAVARSASCASPTEHGLARVGNSDAHALAAIGTGWTTFPGRDAADLRRAIDDAARPTTAATFHATGGPARDVRASSCASAAATLRDEARAAASAATAPAATTAIPGGRLRPPRFDRATCPRRARR